MTPKYTPLRTQSPSTVSGDIEDDESPIHRNIRRGMLLVSVLLNGCLLLLWMNGYPSHAFHDWGETEPLYSPAQDYIRYERRVFNYLGEKTIYHGPPTDETDIAWNALYPVAETRIPRWEADLMQNSTDEIPGDPGHYIIALDVFHQLHCLNQVRKYLSPERYGPIELDQVFYDGEWIEFDHADHCINVIRESLVCSADLTPNVWQWDERINLSWPHFDSIHTCRSWDAITEWAAEHDLVLPYDKHKFGGHHHHKD